jgi:hypothetical protein
MGLFGPTKKQLGERAQAHVIAKFLFATTSLRSRSTNGRVTYSRAGYQGQVDYFAVYSHELRKVYLLPINEVSPTQMHLRLAPSKNKQERGIHWAADYEI